MTDIINGYELITQEIYTNQDVGKRRYLLFMHIIERNNKPIGYYDHIFIIYKF